ncbi:hypothetical protein, partial [Pseudonocardia benzenivorans]
RAAAPRTAAQRAYARRDDRLRRVVGVRGPRTGAAPAGRAQFVLLVMVLLAAGLVATLWLSTAAAADSYRLQDAGTRTRDLTEQSEMLRKQVAALDAAPALAQRATQLGMVPADDPARLVVAADGSVTVVGTPAAATAPAPPPPPPAPPADPNATAAQPGAAPAGQPPAGQAAGDPAAGQPAAGQPAGQPVAGQQAAGQATTGQPTAGQAAAGQPAGQPAGQTAGQPAAGATAPTEDAQTQADAGAPAAPNGQAG